MRASIKKVFGNAKDGTDSQSRQALNEISGNSGFKKRQLASFTSSRICWIMNKEKEKRTLIATKEPLFLVGIAIAIVGVILLTYGFIPVQQSQYKPLTSMAVPINDSQGNFILNQSQYYQAHYNGSGIVDKVECAPQPGSYLCFGYQFTGSTTVFSDDSRIYGLAIVALGIFSVFAAARFGPLAPKESLGRKFRIRVDEDICVANGVCIQLAPTVFKFKEQPAPTIFAPMAYVFDPEGADNATILQAAQMCPTGAIIIEDEETGERIHPPLPKD